MTSEANPVEVPAIDVPVVEAPALEMRGITKRYPGVVANDDIDLDVRPGEIHALLGENGAGKTTLMNILYGLAKPDEGEILLDGKRGQPDRPVGRDRPRDQHGPPALHARPGPDRRREHRPRRGDDGQPGLPRPQGGRSPDRRARAAVRLRGRPGRQGRLPVGRLAAAGRDPQGALPRRARSSSSTSRPRCSRRRRPRRSSRSCAASRPSGHSIVFISHKLYEVLEIADRITVIRRGKVVGQRIPSETNEEDLAELMVGREVSLTVDRGESHPAGARPRASRAWSSRTTAARRPSTASTSRSGPARSSASPAWPATARTSWSRRSSGCASRPPARSPSTARTSPGTARAMSTAPASPTSRPTATGSGWSCRSRSRTTSS